MVPVIETARLRLRGFTAADITAQAAMLGDPDITRHLGGRTLGREEAWRRTLAGAGMWDLLGYGYWAVELRADGAMIGQTGFGDFKRDLDPSIDGIAEIGWVFAASAHGQGYASEAATAALEWGDRVLADQSFAAIIDPDNAPSIRLARKLGFGEGRPASYAGDPVLLFRRPAARPG
ncbi:MAG: N-acetyltransferase [Alphaproteobacteria bacterium]|nr:N-acetyltransferase [Alphaproteobacteria bacterium]